MIRLNLGNARKDGLILTLKIKGVNGQLILLCDYPENLPDNTRKRVHYALSMIRRLFIVPDKTRRKQK